MNKRYLTNTAIIYCILLTILVSFIWNKEWFYPRVGQESCTALIERNAKISASEGGIAYPETPKDSLLINYLLQDNRDLFVWILVLSGGMAALLQAKQP